MTRQQEQKANPEVVSIQRVHLDIKTAVAALVVVIAGVVSTISGLHMIATSLKDQIHELTTSQNQEIQQIEVRWVDRISKLSKQHKDEILAMEERIRRELKTLENSIPPPEVKIQLDEFRRRIEKIEETINKRGST